MLPKILILGRKGQWWEGIFFFELPFILFYFFLKQNVEVEAKLPVDWFAPLNHLVDNNASASLRNWIACVFCKHVAMWNASLLDSQPGQLTLAANDNTGKRICEGHARTPRQLSGDWQTGLGLPCSVERWGSRYTQWDSFVSGGQPPPPEPPLSQNMPEDCSGLLNVVASPELKAKSVASQRHLRGTFLFHPLMTRLMAASCDLEGLKRYVTWSQFARGPIWPEVTSTGPSLFRRGARISALTLKTSVPFVCFVSRVGKIQKHAWCCAHKYNQRIGRAWLHRLVMLPSVTLVSGCKSHSAKTSRFAPVKTQHTKSSTSFGRLSPRHPSRHHNATTPDSPATGAPILSPLFGPCVLGSVFEHKPAEPDRVVTPCLGERLQL